MKNRWRRRAASALAVVVSAGLVGGCAGNSEGKLDPDNPTVVEVETYYNGAAKIAFDKLVEEFNNTEGSELGVYVKASSSGDMGSLFDSLEKELQKKEEDRELPDIFCCYASTAREFVKKDLLVDLDDYFSEKELSEYVDAYIKEGRVGEDEGLVMFPIAKSTEVMVVNRTDWDRFASDTGAGLQDLSTWEGLVKTAQKYYEWTDAATETPNDGKALFGRDAVANYILTGLNQLGAELFLTEKGKVKIQADREALKKIWDYYYVPYISGYCTSGGRYRSDDMKTGKLLVAIGSSSAGAYYANEVTIGENEPYPIELEVLPIPNFEGTEPEVPQQGAGLAVAKSDEKREKAATVFLKWFTEEKVNCEFSMVSSYLPVKKKANNLEYIEKAAEGNKNIQWNDTVRDTIEVAVAECKNSKLYTMPVFEGSNACRSIVESSLIDKAAQDRQQIADRLSEGDVSLQEAVAEFDTNEDFENWCVQLETQLKQAQK